MRSRPRGYTFPRQFPFRRRLRFQLSQQLCVAPETRRTTCQVLGDFGPTFLRVERERSEGSIRWASLAVRVRKSLREIRPCKVEYVFVLFLEGSAIFHSHSHCPELLAKPTVNLANRLSGRAPA